MDLNGSPTRGLIFDKDGTLIDFHLTWGAVAQQVIQALTGGDPSLTADLAQVWEFDLDTGRFADTSPAVAGTNAELADLAATVLPGVTPEQIEVRLTNAAEEAQVVPIPGLTEALGALARAGLRLGVMTNDAESAARAHLTSLNVAHVFDVVVGSDSGHGAKPDAAPLLACAAAMDLEPQHVAMVGDSTHDLIAGRAGGMMTIGVLTGTVGADVLDPFADVILPSVADLPGFLSEKSA